MAKSGNLALVPLLVLSLGLAACGGGGGVNSTPTPSPTPGPTPTPTPTAANDDLLSPLVSESFANLANTASVTYQKATGSRSGSTATANATIAYNAASQSYALTVDGRTRTFAASNIDPVLSTAQQTVYKLTSGSTVDTLTLTKPGTSAPLTYQYVGSAFWQRTSETTTTIGGTLDALVYGVPTLAGDMPTSGVALYSFDVVGATSQPDNVYNLSGTGQALADFSAGKLSFTGRMSSASLGYDFSSNATITSGSGSFSGTFSAPGPTNSFNGTLFGRFFGPDAQELGASFRSTSSSGGDVMVGAILGRNLPTGNNADFANLTQPQLFSALGKQVTFDSNNEVGAATIVSTGDADVQVLYAPPHNFNLGEYTFLKPGGSVRYSTMPTQDGVQDSSTVDYAGLRFLRGRSGWLRYTNSNYAMLGKLVNFSSGRYVFEDFLFGFNTPRASLPSGRAGFLIDVNKIEGLYFGATSKPISLGGRGRLELDMAAGSLDLDALLYHSNSSEPSDIQNASLIGTALLAAGSSNFSGTVTISGGKQLTGSWEGGIFGPAANEVAALISARAPTGELATITFIADRNDAIVANLPTLAQLNVPTQFNTYYGLNQQRSSTEFTNADLDVFTFTYDPTTGNYIIPTDVHSDTGTPVTFAASGFDAAQSNATWNFRRSASGDQDLRILATGPDAPITLTYASFAMMTTRRPPGASNQLTNNYFFAYGVRTPADRLPLTGTASYTGIALGNGYVRGLGQFTEVEGTFVMSFDFGRDEVSGTFDLVALDPLGGADRSLGLITGTRDSLSPGFYEDFSGYSPAFLDNNFTFLGNFFGPNVEEVAGMWTWRKGSFSDPEIAVSGVFAGTADD